MRHLTPLRRATATLALACGLGAAGVAVPAPAVAFTSTNGVRLNAFEARITSLINNARTSRGIPALTVAAGTTDLARTWALNQATKNVLYHNPGLVAGIQAHGSADWRGVGENVGRGSTADSLFTAYMNSPGHRANILDAGYHYLGIGWFERPDGSGYNTQVFVDRYSSTYGRSRVPAMGGLADTRRPASSTSIASFENGWDPRVFIARSGAGIGTSGPYFPSPGTGDQSVRFGVWESLVAPGGAAELRIRDAVDLRNATGVRVRLYAVTGSGRPVTLQVGARRELGSNAVLGSVVVRNGQWVTVTLPVPSNARNFRNALSVTVTRAALENVSGVLSNRRVSVRVADVTVVV